MVLIMKLTKIGLFISLVFATSGAQSAPLLGGTLNNQSVFSHTYTTTGAAGPVTIYGNVLSNQDVTLGAGATVDGNIQTRDITAGAGATITGSTRSTGATTLGAGAMVIDGPVTHGTALTIGAGATPTSGTQITNTLLDEHLGVSAAQTALNGLTPTNTIPTGNIATNATFSPGVHSVPGLLTTTAGVTLTLDAGGDGNAYFIFNVASYLSFGANTKVVVTNYGATDTGISVVWNSVGYTSVGANANIIGTILANTYVSTGAGSVVHSTGNGDGDANQCGGVFSATSYVTVGANGTVGDVGCKLATNLCIEDRTVVQCADVKPEPECKA